MADINPPSSLTGRKIGPYSVGKCLGEGGAGVVYQATDTRIPRSVAIKALREGRLADPQQKRRFLDEMRHLCRVEHSYVIRVYDTVEHDGELLLVMEHVRGRTLATIIAQGLLGRAEALRYSIELCEALGALHRMGLVHRDVKPGNIMVAEDGHVRLMDFGLVSRASSGLSSAELTRSATTESLEPMLAGTVTYMSPEQLKGGRLGPRSDLFSLGIVLCELFTGAHPFGESALRIIAAIERDPPLSHNPELQRRFLVDPVSRVVSQLLEKEPERRPASAEQVIASLRALEPRGALRRRRLWRLGAASITLAAVSIAWLLLSRDRVGSLSGPDTTIARSPQAANLVERAEGLTREYRFGAALDLLEQALELEDDSFYALWKRAEIEDAVGRRADAIRTIDLAVTKIPETAASKRVGLRVRGFQAKLAGNLAAAVALYRDAAASSSAGGQDLRAYAGVLAESGSLDEALAALTRAIDLDPLDTEAFADRARVLVRKGDFAAAFTDIEAAFATLGRLGIERGHGLLHERRAWIYYQGKRYDEALREYQTAEDAYRRDGLELRAADSLRSRGEILMFQWRLDEAAVVLESAIQVAGESGAIDTEIKAWSSLGAVRFRKRELDGAAIALQRSISLARKLDAWNEEASALGNLASVLTIAGRGEEARAAVARMEELARGHSDDSLRDQAVLRAADLAQSLENHAAAQALLLPVLERTRMDAVTVDLRLSTLQRLAMNALDAGDARAALRFANDAISAARFRAEPPRTGYTLTIRSRALARNRRASEARADLDEARALLAGAQSPVLVDALLLAEVTVRQQENDWPGVLQAMASAAPRATSEMMEAQAIRLQALSRLGKADEVKRRCDELAALPWFPRARFDYLERCGGLRAR